MLADACAAGRPLDLVVIGGGATGLGVALDAASRGFSVALLEQSDFGKGTSSRSTKLIHGGVRYLAQGNIALVREALAERTLLMRNAPHVVRPLPLVVPAYRWGQRAYYAAGLWMYDLLAGRHNLESSRCLSPRDTIQRLPTIAQQGLRGGVQYYDAQFDDARLLVNLVQTAVEQGALAVNYTRVVRLLKNSGGRVCGVAARDLETNREFEVRASVVVNAAGPFIDAVRRLDEPDTEELIAPSQGIHLVFDRSFLPGETAVLVPRTSDGRVLFAIPWHGALLAGTTDTPIGDPSLEPRPMDEEIEFVLNTLARYLQPHPTRSDIRSAFAGIRPLVKRGAMRKTAALSRDHTIVVSDAGLLTITGGKWTTYRRMADDCVNRAIGLADWPKRDCVTADLPIHGAAEPTDFPGWRSYYGSDAAEVNRLVESKPRLQAGLHKELPYQTGDVVWAVRKEMARTVDDVLARRTRALLLNAQAALAAAPKVASIMAEELGRDAAWQQRQIAAFEEIARGYLPTRQASARD